MGMNIPTKRAPLTSAEYENYTYVVASARTISKYKQLQASEVERAAAMALFNKQLGTKQPTELRLRPIYFAYEDRNQIIDLFIECLTRLSIIMSISTERDTTPGDMWSKVDAVMTDAVAKNLEIEKVIPLKIGSQHQPYHLLCKSHTVEALDKSNLKVLADIEQKVDLRNLLESINPALKSFFRGKTSVVEAGIEAILNLVTHDKSAKSSSQANLFEFICEREGAIKRIFLYQQRRFAKLGKAAASILNAFNI